jgi:diguanylate cyclase (GGDEF)-like protein
MQGLWDRLGGKLGNLGKFAILGAIPIVIFGALLSYLMNGFVNQRTLYVAETQAKLVAGLGPVQDVQAADITNGERSLRWHELVTDLDDTALGVRGSILKVWDTDLQIVFSSDPGVIGQTSFEPTHLQAGLRGETRAVTEEVEGGETLLSVITPIRASAGGEPIGVLEISVPRAAIAESIKRDFRAFYVVLVIGLNLLYVALFTVMVRASRRLRKRAAEQEHLALHDDLTGLANRALFRDRVTQAIRVAEREQQTIAILLMDLNRFKEINDTLGHHHGDIVLQETARRLKTTLRETDTIARLGGDEFAMVLPHVPDPAAVVHVADKITAALRVPFIVQGLTLDVGASIGVAFFPGHGRDVDTLIQRADVAMYLAKTAQTTYEIYAVEKDNYSPSRLALVGELRHAIEHNEFVVHYQPKVDLQSGKVQGVEALLRWNHPLRDLIPPDEFIPLAEHTGLIEPLTTFVLNEALQQLAKWRDQGLELKVAVNLSTRSLLNTDFPEEVSRALKKWRVPPSSLQLEITEHTILTDPAKAGGILSTLSNMGVELSIDDFGTGYSSFVQLRRLPLTELKIDKSFVMNMNVDDNDAVIVQSLIELGRNLGLQVVAEGVESEGVSDVLTSLGCDYAQGFFTSRPMPPEEIVNWVNITSGPTL